MGMDTKGLRGIRIEVTADDIAKGVRESCQECPIALALERAGFEDAEVDGGVSSAGPWAHFNWCDAAEPVGLPGEAGAFIQAFDEGSPVAPFAFDLDVTP